MAQELEYIEGVVAKMSKTGILLEGKEKWANYTKEEWRGTPWEHCDKGDTVSLGVSKDFIKTIKLVAKGEPPAEKQGGGGRSYGKPLENVQYERASIEFNAAMSEVGQRVSEGKAPKDIEAAYWGHLRRLLRVGLQEAYDAATQAIIATSQMIATPTFLDMRAEIPPDAVVAGAPIPPETPQEGQETASAPLDHIPGRSDRESHLELREALLRVGESLKWTGNVSTGDGKIRPGKEWWDKFALAAEIAKVRVALENAHKMLEELHNE